MELAGEITERTTAATDAVLALAAAAGLVCLRRTTPPSFGRTVWQGALAALTAASLLGAAAHGLALTPAARALLWQPLYLTLGVMMALFVVGAVRDWRGDAAGRRTLGPMLVLAVVFYGLTRLTGGNFLAFVVYETAALVFSLAVYLTLASGPAREGVAPMAAALAVSLAAGVIQASGLAPVRLVWEFDHNGVYHLVQLLGLLFLLSGLRRLLLVSMP
jgi:Family of unknown function (DUF6962)